MFTYINENFLHAPSTDLNRDTVKTLIHVTLAQAQEVFLEKQIADAKKPGFLAKLASQAAYLYSQAAETMQEFVSKDVFDKVWSIVVQAKAAHMGSVAFYYQAIADNEGGSHGVAIARLKRAEKQAMTAFGWAKSFPSSVPAASNLTSESGPALVELIKHNQSNIQSKLGELIKDNDFIYHQPVPNEASLSAVAKMAAAKAIPVSELYQGQDIQRIIGPDIFQKLVPMSVTETASLYDEEKAKLIRAETEKVETANGEMAASLDYLKLPGSLNILKGGLDQEMTVDEEFRRWCSELAGHKPFNKALDELHERKADVQAQLDQCSKQLDLEESVCEKMRSKYGADWNQQPSARLNTTLRGDVRTYRDTITEASASDNQLSATFRQYESDFDQMRSAGETDEADILFQQAMIKAGSKHKGKSEVTGATEGSLLDDVYDEGGVSVSEQINKVEEILKKLNLVKRERANVLKDLKEKVGNPLECLEDYIINQIPGSYGRYLQCVDPEQKIHCRSRKPALRGRARKVPTAPKPAPTSKPQTVVLDERTHQDIRRSTAGQACSGGAVQIRRYFPAEELCDGSIQEGVRSIQRPLLRHRSSPDILQGDGRECRQSTEERGHFHQQPPLRRSPAFEPDRARQGQRCRRTRGPRAREAPSADGTALYRAQAFFNIPIYRDIRRPSSLKGQVTTTRRPNSGLRLSRPRGKDVSALPTNDAGTRLARLPFPSSIRTIHGQRPRRAICTRPTLPARRRRAHIRWLQPNGLPLPNPRLPASKRAVLLADICPLPRLHERQPSAVFSGRRPASALHGTAGLHPAAASAASLPDAVPAF